MGTINGQANGDFRLSSSALRILYSLIKDSIPSLASGDGFTQSNPTSLAAGVTAAGSKSALIPSTVKRGVLSGSVAFTRPDAGQNMVGGAAFVGTAAIPKCRPLGLFINDAVGNAYENTPGVASGKGPFLRGGACGVKIYETQQQIGGIGLLSYSVGDRLYASVNGLLTNRWQDSYEAMWITAANLGGATSSGAAAEYDCTCMGVVLSTSDSNSTEMFLELSF